MVLVIALRTQIEQVYRAEAPIVFAELAEYEECLAGTGRGVRLIYLDSADEMARWELKPVYGMDPSALRAAAHAVLTEMGAELVSSSLVLIGGPRLLPFFQVPNPALGGVDQDFLIDTDNPYGADGTGIESWLLPKAAVGRILDGGTSSAEDFRKILRCVITNHGDRPNQFGSVAFLEGAWSERILKSWRDQGGTTLPPPLRLLEAPSRRSSDGSADVAGRFLYFNLHGFSDQADWFGYDPRTDQFVSCVSPNDLRSEGVAGASVFIANCYGGNTREKSAANSGLMRLLQNGSGPIVAASGLAFGSYDQGQLLDNADEFAQHYLSCVTQGMASGMALVEARRRYFVSASEDKWNVYEMKTALQFSLFGDPLLN